DTPKRNPPRLQSSASRRSIPGGTRGQPDFRPGAVRVGGYADAGCPGVVQSSPLAPGRLGLVRRNARRNLRALCAHPKRVRITREDLEAREAEVVEHRGAAGAVEEPEDGRIEVFALWPREHPVRV